MDSRAKQRLTGAVILVALFVLLVPELLTGPREAHPPADDGSETGLRQYTIDLDSQERGPTQADTPDDSSVALPPVVTPMNGAPRLAQPGESAAPEEAAAPATNPMAPSGATNNVAAPTPAPPARPAAPATSPEKRSEAPPPAPTNQRAERGTFVVQLGSFSVRANADRLARDMTARGFAAFVVPITSKGRELFAVRVGPVRDRAAAEALAAELKRAGQSGSIVSIS
jgi:DedD protein